MSKIRLARHMLRLGARNLRGAHRELGWRRVLLFLGIYLWMAVIHVTWLLDRVFFPGHRSIQIERPVFIMGLGRTGSTLLYRLLNCQNDYAASRFWHVLVPSLTLRAALRPMVAIWKRLGGPASGQEGFELVAEEEGHETTLTTLEEDEMVLAYLFDTQHLSYSTPLGLHPDGFPELVYHDQQPHREDSVRFFRRYLQKQIAFLGRRQVVSKAIFSTFRLEILLREFPDARFVLLVRSPLESIPSHMTLHATIMRKFHPGVSRESVERLMRHRYRYNCESLLRFESLLGSGAVDATRFLEVRYEDLMEDLEATMEQIVAFTGIEVTPALRQRWACEAPIQAAYRRVHANLGLEALGLTEEKVRGDLEPIFSKYGF